MAKILVVDDENLILYSLGATLKLDGSEVTAVMNGKDALNEVHRMTYDICFLDVHLPDANGLDLMKIFREISPATKIIIMTAMELNDRQLDDLRGNACHFLPKPFDLDEVRSLVAQITETGSAGAHNTLPFASH